MKREITTLKRELDNLTIICLCPFVIRFLDKKKILSYKDQFDDKKIIVTAFFASVYLVFIISFQMTNLNLYGSLVLLFLLSPIQLIFDMFCIVPWLFFRVKIKDNILKKRRYYNVL